MLQSRRGKTSKVGRRGEDGAEEELVKPCATRNNGQLTTGMRPRPIISYVRDALLMLLSTVELADNEG
jgi:hypothetical protein